jgi:hypothetical protein
MSFSDDRGTHAASEAFRSGSVVDRLGLVGHQDSEAATDYSRAVLARIDNDA